MVVVRTKDAKTGREEQYPCRSLTAANIMKDRVGGVIEPVRQKEIKEKNTSIQSKKSVSERSAWQKAFDLEEWTKVPGQVLQLITVKK